jgi:DNA primase
MISKYPANPPLRPILEHFGFKDLPDTEDDRWFSVRCLFHGDSNASASVNFGIGVYKCHSCPVKGNAIGVVKEVMHIERSGSKRLVESILGSSGYEIPAKSKHSRRRIPFGEGSN